MLLLKIPEYPVLRVIKIGRDLQDHLIQTSTQNYYNHPKTLSPNTTSRCLLNTSRDGDSTTSWDNLFQCVSTLREKSHF